jgi:hypothetical protein
MDNNRHWQRYFGNGVDFTTKHITAEFTRAERAATQAALHHTRLLTKSLFRVGCNDLLSVG